MNHALPWLTALASTVAQPDTLLMAFASPSLL